LDEGIEYLSSEEFKKKLQIDEVFLYNIHNVEDMAKLRAKPIWRPEHGFHIGILRGKNGYKQLHGYKPRYDRAWDMYSGDEKFLHLHNILKETRAGKVYEKFLRISPKNIPEGSET